MDIAIPLFDGITALDAIGPYEVLSRLPGARVRFVAIEPGPKKTDKHLTLVADEPLSAVPRQAARRPRASDACPSSSARVRSPRSARGRRAGARAPRRGRWRRAP